MNGDQDKLNETMRRHLEFMKSVGDLLKFGGCVALIAVGYLFMLQTKGHFGDVPMVLGVYWMSKVINQ